MEGYIVFGYIIGAIIMLAGFCVILTTHRHLGWLEGVAAAEKVLRPATGEQGEGS